MPFLEEYVDVAVVGMPDVRRLLPAPDWDLKQRFLQ